MSQGENALEHSARFFFAPMIAALFRSFLTPDAKILIVLVKLLGFTSFYPTYELQKRRVKTT